MNRLLRVLPLTLALLLWLLIYVLWPEVDISGKGILPWFNTLLLAIASLFLLHYGLKLALNRQTQKPGSALRAKLVIALVGMLLIPAGLLQTSASYVVNKGLDVWFDVRVETVLNRAMQLAQGFYGRIDQDLQRSLLETINDSTFRAQLALLPLSNFALNSQMNQLAQRYGWQSMEIFDRNERLIAAVRKDELAPLKADPLSEQARLAMTLGKVATEIQRKDGQELYFGYAPIRIHQNIISLIRVNVSLPDSLVEHARAVEKDYRSYRELDRHRQSLGLLFNHLMTFITMIIVLASGFIALIFARKLTDPVEQLAEALERVTHGDLDVLISSAPNDELGSLVNSFNIMSKKLKSNVQAVEKAQQELGKTLADSQQRKHILENLLANLQTGVLLLDQRGCVHLSNQAFVQLLDIQPELLQEMNQMSDAVSSPAISTRVHLVQQLLEEMHSNPQETLQRQMEVQIGQRQRLLLVRGISFEIPDPSNFIGHLLVFDDISDLAEAQRHQAWVEVAQRVAHEIKNPLTPIKLAAERMQKRITRQDIDPKIFEQCTQAIIRQSNRLLRLTSDFSKLSSQPKPRCASVSVELFSKELADLYSAYPRVNVRQLETSWSCICDADQIRQVLINLMDNALAATEAERKPVRMYITEEADYTLFHIEDDGTGIIKDNQHMVFEPYFSTKQEGSGLGLSISQRITQEHGGELVLASSENPTHFYLRIPNTPENSDTA